MQKKFRVTTIFNLLKLQIERLKFSFFFTKHLDLIYKVVMLFINPVNFKSDFLKETLQLS